MDSEKKQVRQIRSDREKRPRFALATVVLAVVHIMLALGLYGMEAAQPLLIMMLGAVALVLTVVAAAMWSQSRPLRVTVRTVGLVVVAALLVFTVFSICYDLLNNTDVSSEQVLYFIELYGSLAAIYGQLLLVFLLPIALMSASFGFKLDRFILRGMAIANTVLVGVLMFAVEPFGLLELPDGLDGSIVKLLYLLFSAVIAVLTFVPALYDNRPRSNLSSF